MNATWLFPFVLFFWGAIHVGNAQTLPLSTTSDSCLYYYYEGWKEVMDHGNYTASAQAYRKMAGKDPEFLIGQSLLARISTSLTEQQQIFYDLEEKKGVLTGDERLLLDVYMELLKLMIVRQTNPEEAGEQRKRALALGEKHLRHIVHRYPDEVYYKAEYIEVLHYNYGAAKALDSLYVLATPEQQKNSFLLGYAAVLQSELGRFETALTNAKALVKRFDGQAVPKPHAVLGAVYFEMDRKEEALKAVERALALDPGNIDAQRLKGRLLKSKREP